jgi:hypothetical protein
MSRKRMNIFMKQFKVENKDEDFDMESIEDM